MTGKALFKTAAMGKCQSNFPFYEGQKLVIGREPVYTAEFLGAKPSGGFVLIQLQGVVYQGAHIAMHREMEHGIVSLDGSKEFIDTDFGVQLLSYLAPERLDWAFPGFYLAPPGNSHQSLNSPYPRWVANTFPSRIMTAATTFICFIEICKDNQFFVRFQQTSQRDPVL